VKNRRDGFLGLSNGRAVNVGSGQPFRMQNQSHTPIVSGGSGAIIFNVKNCKDLHRCGGEL